MAEKKNLRTAITKQRNKHLSGNEIFIALTSARIRELKHHKNRTGIGPSQLLKIKNEYSPPKGLTSAIIHSWFAKTTTSALKDHYNYALATWKNQPDLPHVVVKIKLNRKRRPQASDCIQITKDMYKALSCLRRDTGIGGVRLLKDDKNVPDGLTPAMINSWFNKQTLKASKSHYEFVLKKYEQIKDALPTVICDRDYKKLLFYKDLGFIPGKILQTAADIPRGLNTAIIKTWLQNRQSCAHKEYLEYVLKKCEALFISKQNIFKSFSEEISF